MRHVLFLAPIIARAAAKTTRHIAHHEKSHAMRKMHHPEILKKS